MWPLHQMTSDLHIEVTPWILEKNWWKIRCYFKDNAMFTVWTPDLTWEHGNKTQTMGPKLKVKNASGTQAINICTETSGGKLKGHHLLLSVIIIDLLQYFLIIDMHHIFPQDTFILLSPASWAAPLSRIHHHRRSRCKTSGTWHMIRTGNILPWWWYSTALIMLPPAQENELYSGSSLGKHW